MQAEGLVHQRLKQVLFRHLQKELRANFKCYPESCRHNRGEMLLADGYDEGAVGVCGYVREGKPLRIVCDSRIAGGQEQARICEWWTPLRDKKEIRQDFHKLISGSDLGAIASKYPDAAALMWVLGSGVEGYLAEVEAEIDQETP